MNTYSDLKTAILNRINHAQLRAGLAVNAELLALYWDVGRIIAEKQQVAGWGAKIIPQLAKDFANELADVKGFSQRNLNRMLRFYREYTWLRILPPPVAKLEIDTEVSDQKDILPLPVAKLTPEEVERFQSLLPHIPWTQNVLLLEQVKDLKDRLWYMEQCVSDRWSKEVLFDRIRSQVHRRQGKATSNFSRALPEAQSEQVQAIFKDPYIMDFVTLLEPYRELDLEAQLVQHVQKFLLELGQGFAFVGRQYHLAVGGQDYYLDLLFYHLKLRRYVVIELKKGNFTPEYAGKLNFYLSAVDDLIRDPELDQPSIGIILCQGRDKVVAEYALRDVGKPIGVSDYELTRALPGKLRPSLPTVEEIEDGLEMGALQQGDIAYTDK